MDDSDPTSSYIVTSRPAWNKGKIIGARPPLRPGHVWSIRAKLQLERRLRDLALFNLAIDSKLRGRDLVTLRVSDVARNGYALDRASVRQKKTGRPVRFELTEQTRQSVDEYLRSTGRVPTNFYFPDGAGPIDISRRGSMRASLLAGSIVSASAELPCSARQHFRAKECQFRT